MCSIRHERERDERPTKALVPTGATRPRHTARAAFIGLTGTPIELGDKSTRAVFGDHISVYDIARAVEDGATVPIFYESRLVPLRLDAAERPKIDDDFEEVTEGEEIAGKEKLKTKWAALEALIGTEDHLARLAKDLVEHFENRLSARDGKAMVVCMSRQICVDLYEAIRKLRPEWHGDDDDTGVMKVVMTGDASDVAALKPHIRTKGRLRKLALHFKDPAHPFQIVIVRDMWLTGFDAPSLHTMYIDKPMRGHSLMQAIARVNRVFRDKPGGLELVDLVKRNVTIDWTQKESVKAKLRVIVKRILRKHGYPPDKQEAATTTVLEQAELLSTNWVDAS